jgi:membrane-associated HD superfamily phosphohydrolase|tara:strand:+ start:283 stop:1572 length:1290 start_codon:yes stop_codon:yes gene_type:complete
MNYFYKSFFSFILSTNLLLAAEAHILKETPLDKKVCNYQNINGSSNNTGLLLLIPAIVAKSGKLSSCGINEVVGDIEGNALKGFRVLSTDDYDNDIVTKDCNEMMCRANNAQLITDRAEEVIKLSRENLKTSDISSSIKKIRTVSGKYNEYNSKYGGTGSLFVEAEEYLADQLEGLTISQFSKLPDEIKLAWLDKNQKKIDLRKKEEAETKRIAEEVMARAEEKRVAAKNIAKAQQKKIVADTKGIKVNTNSYESNEDSSRSGELFLWFIGILSLILFLLTVSNRVTFFSSNSDFVSSFISVFFLGALIAFMPEYYSDWKNLTTGQSTFVVIITLALSIVFIFTFFSSLSNSITANGFLMGVIIFIYKLVVGTALSIVILSKISEALDYKKQGTRNTFAAILVLMAIFKPLLKLLVNGERVKARKLNQV